MAKNGKVKDQPSAKAPGRFTRQVERAEKPRKKRAKTPLLVGMGYGVAMLATAGAVCITSIAIVSIWRPALIDSLHFLGEDYRSNIVIGAIYFWIEVAAIIVGVRLLDQNLGAAARKGNIVKTYNRLNTLQSDLDDLRYNFAVNLDNASGRAYTGADFGIINRGLAAQRAEMIAFFLRLDRFEAVEGKIYDRVIRLFDIHIRTSGELADHSEQLRTKLSDAVQKSKDAPADETAAAEVKEIGEDLERLIEKLMACANVRENSIRNFTDTLNKVLAD